MKIISKHKDYYDFAIERYGFDATRVYDRRNADPEWATAFPNQLLAHDRDNVTTFAICGKIVQCIKVDGKFYYERELTEMNNAKAFSARAYLGLDGYSTDLNIEYRQPVLLLRYTGRWDGKIHGSYGYKPVCIPQLSVFQFHKAFEPYTMYGKIYDYLGFLVDNPPIPNNQTDLEKTAAHGFDTKRSFRPKIKS